MNILLVTRPLSPPWNEGGKNLAYGIARNTKNNNIHLLVRKNFNEKLNKNIILHKIYPTKHKYNISFFEKFKLFFFLLRIKNIDIYHFIYTPELYSSFINKLILKIKGKKSIQTIPTRLKDIDKIRNLIFADKIIAITDFTKNLFLNNGIKNVIRINTGIDVNYFKPFKKDKNLLNKFNLIDKYIILVPIDIEKRKSTRMILNLIKDLQDIENLKFMVPYRATKEKIKEEIAFKNYLKKLNLSNKILFFRNPDIRNLINISNLMIYPVVDTYEKHEIPMILLECMAMEKPIIMFDIAPFNEIIKNKEGIKVKNELEMKNAILKFIKNKSLAKKIGKLARKRVVNDFNINKTAQLYNKVYKNLLIS